MQKLRLASLVALLIALPGQASADEGLYFQIGGSTEGSGSFQGPYTTSFLLMTIDASLGIPVNDPFEIVVGGFMGVGVFDGFSLGLGSEGEKRRPLPGLLGVGAGGALRLGGWRFSALGAVVASRLRGNEGYVEPPVGPGLRAEISHTWWMSDRFGMGLGAYGTLARITPDDETISVGSAGAGYFFVFR